MYRFKKYRHILRALAEKEMSRNAEIFYRRDLLWRALALKPERCWRRNSRGEIPTSLENKRVK
jgi:hypothetical protein